MTGLAWMTIQEACDLLRVSEDNADLIQSMAVGIPMTVEMTTDYPADCVASYNCDPMVQQLCRFILTLWYCPDGTDVSKLARVIDSMSFTVKSMVIASKEQS